MVPFLIGSSMAQDQWMRAKAQPGPFRIGAMPLAIMRLNFLVIIVLGVRFGVVPWITTGRTTSEEGAAIVAALFSAFFFWAVGQDFRAPVRLGFRRRSLL